MSPAASCPTAACLARRDQPVKVAISLAPRSSSNSTGFAELLPNPPNKAALPTSGGSS